MSTAEVEQKLDKMTVASPSSISHLTPSVDQRFGHAISHYRNIPYATISKRFAKPSISPLPKRQTDCTKFGPQCPQLPISTHEFYSIPGKDTPDIKYHELKCTNLNISVPSNASGSPLPVLIWFYGGAIMQAWPSAQHKVGDPAPIVAQSVQEGKPVILVTVNFRLNIFSFGTGEEATDVNLMLYDQLAAISWVQSHISKFGGDPSQVTISGESAGAICCNTLVAMGAKVQRAILASGSQFTSPPQKDRDGFGLIGLIEGNLQLMEFDKGNTSGDFTAEATMLGAKSETLLQCLKDLQIARMWFWDEPELKSWKEPEVCFGTIDALMIGDVRDEAFYMEPLFSQITAKEIARVFSMNELASKLASEYGISSSTDDEQARTKALAFVGDARFNAWPKYIVDKVNADSGKTKAYRYLYDEQNPFNESMVGHAVDLLAIFGGYDDQISEQKKKAHQTVRTKWINFVNGEEPWSSTEVFGFGPDGQMGSLNDGELTERRRTKCLDIIREAGAEKIAEIWQRLVNVAASTLEQ